GEIFNTPEFTDSALGAEHHSQEILERYADDRHGGSTGRRDTDRPAAEDGDRATPR
ncbi:hypothetical protein FHS23_003317, partial [Prauserella isguenensis]|nr:hypothetical protein [Prauserella isguenensis]